MYNYKNVDIMTQFIKVHNKPKVSHLWRVKLLWTFCFSGSFLTRGFEHTGLGQD